MASKYELPVWALLRKCIAESTEPMTRQQIIRWFERYYPDIKSVTVGTHIFTRCVQRSYRLGTGEKHDILYLLPDGRYVAYDPERHGRFDEKGQPIGGSVEGHLVSNEELGVEVEPQAQREEETGSTFELERDLQRVLRQDISQLEPGLRIVDGGSERKVEAGFIDITAEDSKGNLVVIELKVNFARPDSLAQVMAYMASLRDEENRPVRGILVAADFHDRLLLAAQVAPNLLLKTYSYKFTFEDM